MSKGSYYWAGQGVYNFDGTDYARGDKLPATVPAETLAALLDKGKVSTSPLVAPAAPQADDGRLTAALETIKAMEAAAQDGMARISELEKTGTEREEVISDLRSQLAAAQATINEMTAAQLAPPAAPAGAGPKSK